MHPVLAVVMLTVTTMALFSAPAEDFDPGLRVGESLPPFRFPDQSGMLHDFNSLTGPKGLSLLFFRSADW
jgi:hypothetical protein